jgi:hypothetical protein
LQNSSLLAAKIKRHVESKHADLFGKAVAISAAKLDKIKIRRLKQSQATANDKLLEASYVVSKKITSES